MLRAAIWLLLAFAGAVLLALVLRTNHGNIAILWPPYRIELSSNMALVLGVLGFFVMYVLLRLISHALGLPQRIRRFRERRREQRAGRALEGAVVALFEGRYERAEKLAATAADASVQGSNTVAAAALLAARSAHRLGESQRRDDWVRQATAAGRGHAATLMVQAEFALDDQQPERALDAVDRMSAGGTGQQVIALETALGAYQQSGRWDQVLETVRQLVRRGRLRPVEADALRLTAFRQLLKPLAGDTKAIRELWKSLKADERKQAALAAPTVIALADAGAPDDAKKIAFAVMDGEYDESIAEAYGAMAALPARQRLEQLERWRARHGDRPKLLEMLGRVCASERLWGKAEAYLIGALNAGDSVSGRVALAQLYESIGRSADSARQFQYAARLALGERPPIPAAEDASAAVAGKLGDNPSGILPAAGDANGGGAASVAAAGVASAAISVRDKPIGKPVGEPTGKPIGKPDAGAAPTAGATGAGVGHPAAGAAAAATGASLPFADGVAGDAVDAGDNHGSEADAGPAIQHLKPGAGDELGFIGRKD